MISVEEYLLKPLDYRKQHLNLQEHCFSTISIPKLKKLLAEKLNVDLSSGRVLICHGCNNSKCSNINHVYFGTDYENIVIDGKKFGTFENVHARTIKKYGKEKIKEIKARGDKSKGGKGNKDKKKSNEHKKKISDSIKEWHHKHKIHNT